VKTMKTSYVVFFAALLAGTCAFAHHSAAMFDFGPDKQKTIEGVVKDFQWTNPHTWIVLSVKNEAGQTEEWGFEGMSPNWLGRHGWSRHTLQPGAGIAMGFAPLRDGRKGGFTLTVHLPDGTVLQELPSGASPQSSGQDQ